MVWDTIIVGAGPAGSTAAKYLGDAGVKVLLVDKEKFPRAKVCADVLLKKIFEDFPYLNKHSKKFVERKHYSIKQVIKGREYVCKSKDWVWQSTIRKNFDDVLYKLAKKAGANTLTAEIKDLNVLKDKVEIITNKGKLESKIVIGADGARSIVAKKTGLHDGWKPNEFATCTVATINLNKKLIDSMIEEDNGMYIEFADFVGYGYSFAQNKTLNIGYGNLASKGKTAQRFKEFVQRLKTKKIIPESSKVDYLRAGIAPVTGPLEKTYTNRIILCGDAGGFLNPLNGEGIHYAMITGKEAANVIIEALNKKEYSETTLQDYQNKWKTLIGTEIETTIKFKKILYSGWANFYPLLFPIIRDSFPDFTSYYEKQPLLKKMINIIGR